MGTSNWQNISYNIDLIKKINPQKILDIGCGFGRWGFLCREFLDVWDDGNYKKSDFSRTIDAVEIYENYIQAYHHYFYNNIYIENAVDFLYSTTNSYDLIIAGDVIEHLPKKDGFKLIKLALNKSKFVMINIPVGKDWPQEASEENIYEEHRSIWFKRDFSKFKHKKIRKFYDFIYRPYLVIVISNEKFNLNKLHRQRFGSYIRLKSLIPKPLKKIIKKLRNR
ncbi:MAG: class I SAM-dependent methyltransferase [Ignavibacteria bacterium]